MIPFRQLFLSENAISVEFSDEKIDIANQYVTQLTYQLKLLQWDFVVDIIPAYRSVCLIFDLIKINNDQEIQLIYQKINHLAKTIKINHTTEGRLIKIPVCYDLGLDIEEIASNKNVSKKTIIDWHTSRTYQVYMLGFLPGFPYMGSVVKELETPRKSQPRKEVEAGSVGIAGVQTGIYPLHSPGGWMLLGKTPLKIFDPNRPNPCLFQQGDGVQFYEINENIFNQMNEYQ